MHNSRLDQLLKFYNEDQSDPFILFALAKEYENLKETSKALEHFKLLEEQHPDYVGTYYHLAKLYEELDDVDAALSIYQKGIEIAESRKDHHALSELKNAKLNLELEEGL